MLLYYLLERQVNHATGNLVESIDVAMAYSELLSNETSRLYPSLINTMLRDVRLRTDQAEQLKKADNLSKLDRIRLNVARGYRRADTHQIIKEVYMGSHPLAEFDASS